jgi:hypothetical protein
VIEPRRGADDPSKAAYQTGRLTGEFKDDGILGAV